MLVIILKMDSNKEQDHLATFQFHNDVLSRSTLVGCICASLFINWIRFFREVPGSVFDTCLNKGEIMCVVNI